jgi:hypothetical protein
VVSFVLPAILSQQQKLYCVCLYVLYGSSPLREAKRLDAVFEEARVEVVSKHVNAMLRLTPDSSR